MAAPLLLFTSIYLFCCHFSVIECRNTMCFSNDCRKTTCPSTCSCLGTLVDCSKRGLVQLPKDIPVWVKRLDLQDNDISSIDDDALSELKNLTELDLSNNQLGYLNISTLEQLSSLQKLIIHKNHLQELPDLGRLPSLTTLSLQHNEIHYLNSSILKSLPNLDVLDLSFNNIVDLPANTFGYSTSLRHLSLSHNRIVTMEKGVFDNFTALESLKINKNKLSSIPKELFRNLGTLRHLEMNANNLTHIDGLSFQGLVSLAVLKLRLSGISYLLDGAFYGLNSIKKLQLDYNGISKVTKGWLYGLNSLQRLYLNNNNISEIEDDAWDSGKRLLELDMTHNMLQFISVKTFDKLYSLKRLILSDNMITYIEEGAFRSLTALQYLELSNNEVSWTIEDSGRVFAGLERLKYLGLSNNKIKAVVKRAFDDLLRLETMNLTHNRLTTIERHAFDDLPQLRNLIINSSSLLCDCNLAWMSQDFHYRVAAKCGYPEKFMEMSVFDLKPSEFLCEGSPKPVILKEPFTKITLKGENVTLECQARSSGISDVKFQWRKDGKILQGMRLWSKNANTKEGNYTLHNSWLFIENIQDSDEGHYQCVISNRFGSVYSNKASITVHVFPVFTKTPVDVAIKSGSTARLECGAKGQPQPDIAWRKDGGVEDFPAARERRMHVMLPTDDIFFIVDVKASDTGVYSCTAQNVAGVITANATLTVLETPSFVKRMENKEIKIGENTVLECRASGSPKPRISWSKDGAPLIATERHFLTADNQLLIIVDSKTSDSGSYTCEMSNTLGTERGSSNLKVIPANQSGSSVEENNMTGIIVIAVVVCVVGTSIVWVIVIHRTRKTRDDFVTTNANGAVPPADIGPFNTGYRTVCPKDLKQSVTNVYLDSHSGHSKDSGTGDSAQPSSDDLLIEDDDHGLLLDIHSPSIHGACQGRSLLALQESGGSSQRTGEPYASSSGSVSKEQVPLLQSFRTSRSSWKNHRKSIAEFRQQPFGCGVDKCSLSCNGTKWSCVLVQRSLSADQVNSGDVPLHHRGCSEPPENIVTIIDGSHVERDSGFSTFPRSVTQASVHWSTESPRLHRLPKDVPNDSGSFSIASEEVHVNSSPIMCAPSTVETVTSLSRTPKSCNGSVEQKV